VRLISNLGTITLLMVPAAACGRSETPPVQAASVPLGAALVEAASIGADRGPNEVLFGRISSVWEHEGKIYVVDSQVPAVQVFSPTGGYLRTIGREGDGPGEYRRPLAVTVKLNGDVLLLDKVGPQNRIQVYAPTGQYQSALFYDSAEIRNFPFGVDSEGTIWAPYGTWIQDGERRREVLRGYILISDRGSVAEPVVFPEPHPDRWSLLLPNGAHLGRVPYAPTHLWTVGPEGMTVRGHSAEYEFTIEDRSGKFRVVRGSDDLFPIRAAEARFHRARRLRSMRRLFPGIAWDGPELPEFKPAYGQIVIAQSGEIWVVRQGDGRVLDDCRITDPITQDELSCWRSATWAEVFNSAGQYLGNVTLPSDIQSLATAHISDRTMVIPVQDEAGTLFVKRYSFDLPSPTR